MATVSKTYPETNETFGTSTVLKVLVVGLVEVRNALTDTRNGTKILLALATDSIVLAGKVTRGVERRSDFVVRIILEVGIAVSFEFTTMTVKAERACTSFMTAHGKNETTQKRQHDQKGASVVRDDRLCLLQGSDRLDCTYAEDWQVPPLTQNSSPFSLSFDVQTALDWYWQKRPA